MARIKIPGPSAFLKSTNLDFNLSSERSVNLKLLHFPSQLFWHNFRFRQFSIFLHTGLHGHPSSNISWLLSHFFLSHLSTHSQNCSPKTNPFLHIVISVVQECIFCAHRRHQYMEKQLNIAYNEQQNSGLNSAEKFQLENLKLEGNFSMKSLTVKFM